MKSRVGANGRPVGTSFVVHLQDGCRVVFSEPRPNPGDLLFCRLCQHYSEALSVRGEIRVRCETAKCNLSKGFGADIKGAERYASKHATARPSHTAIIVQGATTLKKITSQDQGLPQTWLSEFHMAHPKHQSTLRNLGRRVDTQPT